MTVRTGLGYDIHRLADGRRLVLGGVEIKHPRGLLGHSDADVLAHAVIDALLGAAALGDIGTHFPDTDEQYKDADSCVLLATVASMVRGHGFDILNVDSTVVARAPKLAPHIAPLRSRLAEAMDLPLDRVSVKAKTGDEVGPVGEGKAIAAYAIALVRCGPEGD
jgi:2-C-methyl-D-erythritol 2,4-cyclodiphosphate synthase